MVRVLVVDLERQRSLSSRSFSPPHIRRHKHVGVTLLRRLSSVREDKKVKGPTYPESDLGSLAGEPTCLRANWKLYPGQEPKERIPRTGENPDTAERQYWSFTSTKKRSGGRKGRGHGRVKKSL